ncbi:hypothetical protein GWI33_021101 [Rhynchophorus ferrugineus]|uniref:PDZ domain-containing protein n=1 Tax=Rhynchophorus ferrugineus TaxID=354439 RepID=A0A834HNA4_RHYFE|nr:hypothetical protein GWI33_021101 [Rhynchophorus ferrugineus]
MAEELLVVLNRNENSGFGFSLLGKPGLPPIIYNILDDSPAAESGELRFEVGLLRGHVEQNEHRSNLRSSSCGNKYIMRTLN